MITPKESAAQRAREKLLREIESEKSKLEVLQSGNAIIIDPNASVPRILEKSDKGYEEAVEEQIEDAEAQIRWLEGLLDKMNGVRAPQHKPGRHDEGMRL